MNNVVCADCIEFMKTMDENSIDSIVTDPPYGLNFMGKEWDGCVPGIEIWKEALRVAKPGAHLLAFGGSRTYHRMACAIEDAGWEIRDCVMWVYGSGFPKSLDVSKAIDKALGAEREIVGTVNHPTAKNNDRTGDKSPYQAESHLNGNYKTPASDEAKKWKGWGTALKPACEPIVVARKPISEKSVTENVLKWGTGAINIDECRVQTDDVLVHGGVLRTHSGDTRNGKSLGMFQDGTENTFKQNPNGRWPANLIHDGSEEVLELFPYTTSAKVKSDKDSYDGESNTSFLRGVSNSSNQHGDKGSAARFFYCAKPSKSEKQDGCEKIEESKRDDTRVDGNPGGDNPRNRGVKLVKNNHPTVKPVALMKYLIKLVTQPDGVVLDPFAGSGSTLVAAKELGFKYIGIEKEKQYCEIAEKRLEAIGVNFKKGIWALQEESK